MLEVIYKTATKSGRPRAIKGKLLFKNGADNRLEM